MFRFALIKNFKYLILIMNFNTINCIFKVLKFILLKLISVNSKNKSPEYSIHFNKYNYFIIQCLSLENAR